MIQVQALSKSFKVHQKEPGLKGSLRSLFNRKWIEKHALQDVSLTVGPGEIVGLVGANGAGKTTLVKCLAGIIHPTSGTAQVLGHTPWEREDEFRSQIALIMGQKAQLWWDLPAADCYLLLREIYRIPPKLYRENLDYLVGTLGVRGQLNTQIRKLSLGERMKMELIAALLHQPKIVYLDEPTIGLDLTAQRAIREFLLKYRESHKPAMLITSHYMEDIERLCRRIVILKSGRAIYDGELSQVVRDFASHKIISAHVDGSATELAARVPAGTGEIVSTEDNRLKIKVPRERVPDAAAKLLAALPIVDLNIEEQDIGTVIEAMQR